MRYAAYLKIDGRKLPVFPRGKSYSFKTVDAAAKQLERKAPNRDCFGQVWDRETKELVLTIAL